MQANAVLHPVLNTTMNHDAPSYLRTTECVETDRFKLFIAWAMNGYYTVTTLWQWFCNAPDNSSLLASGLMHLYPLDARRHRATKSVCLFIAFSTLYSALDTSALGAESSDKDLGEEICAKADALEARAVVLLHHGKGMMKEMVFGSITSFATRNCRRPLVVYYP